VNFNWVLRTLAVVVFPLSPAQGGKSEGDNGDSRFHQPATHSREPRHAPISMINTITVKRLECTASLIG